MIDFFSTVKIPAALIQHGVSLSDAKMIMPISIGKLEYSLNPPGFTIPVISSLPISLKSESISSGIFDQGGNNQYGHRASIAIYNSKSAGYLDIAANNVTRIFVHLTKLGPTFIYELAKYSLGTMTL